MLSVRNLTKVYRRQDPGPARPSTRSPPSTTPASTSIPGENLGIVGESGSGKTTLGRLILRIVEPTAGQITYRARRRQRDRRDGRARKRGLADYHREVRLVFQDPFASLNPRMTVKQIIGDPLYVTRTARGAALDEARRATCSSSSASTARRWSATRTPSPAASASASASPARSRSTRKVIIADEATSALDVSIRAQILDLLLAMQKRLTLSYIFISHDISVVRYFCDRVAVMHRGKIVEIGDAEQICTAPREPYTRSLISAVPNPDPRNKRMLHRTKFVA